MDKKVKVQVSATTANLGAGFNCLGLALELYTTLEMKEIRSGINLPAKPCLPVDRSWQMGIEITGEGKNVLPRDEKNLSFQAAYKVFKMCGYSPKGLRIKINNHIPITRGLGSSAASIVAGAVAANEICRKKLSQNELIQLCAEFEGHADNVVAAFLGGLTISGYKNEQLIYKNFFVRHGIRVIIAIPQSLEVKTKDAVAILPNKVPFDDAVFNISRVAFFVSGIISDDLETMGLGMEDHLHQPYRKVLIPGLEDVFEATKKAGAHGVSLSGAGSSVVAITNRYPQPIGEVMKKAFRQNGIEAKVIILDVDNEGVKVQIKKVH